jgi:ATP phosphoribosyltransferase regulatory subunit
MAKNRQPSEERLLRLFAQAGYAQAETQLLQPIDIFLDLSGEDIRRRLYLTQDGLGNALCLRPEFTIPACRDYLASGQAGAVVSHSFLGTIFRQRTGENGEFNQAGIESFGRADTAAADAEILDLALQACALLEAGAKTVRMGDLALLDAFLTALALPAASVRRIRHGLAGGHPIESVLAPAHDVTQGGLDSYAGLLNALNGADGKAARAFVQDVLAIVGVSEVAGRSAQDIAQRFLDKASERAETMPEETLALLRAFLAISGQPDQVSRRLRDFAGSAHLSLGPQLDLFDERISRMIARDIPVDRITVSTAFARNLDYYTGFVFEVLHPEQTKPLVGGGRYDRLLRRLGAERDIPAVGCAIWLERFTGAA